MYQASDNRHLKHISLLAKMAETIIPVRKARIAASLVYRNQIIAIGINQKKSHPFQSKYSKNEDSIFLHAETDCVKNALKYITVDKIRESTLYIARIKYTSSDRNNLIYGLAKPCHGCQKCLAAFSIKRVYYTMDGETITQL